LETYIAKHPYLLLHPDKLVWMNMVHFKLMLPVSMPGNEWKFNKPNRKYFTHSSMA